MTDLEMIPRLSANWQPSHGGDKTDQRRCRQKAEITHRRDRRDAGARATPFEPACRAIDDGHNVRRAQARQGKSESDGQPMMRHNRHADSPGQKQSAES